MEMPAPMEAASPTRNVLHVEWVAKAAANTGARVETEPSISPTSPGCTTCSTKRRRASASSRARTSPGSRRASMVPAVVSCCASAGGQVTQQAADRRVGRPARGLAVEPFGVVLHLAGVVAHCVEPERAELPDGAARGETAHVLAADQRDVRAESFGVGVDQQAPVLVLLMRHVGEDVGGVGVIVSQALGEVAVDAAVLLLVADGEGEDFAFGQGVEGSHALYMRCLPVFGKSCQEQLRMLLSVGSAASQ